jgi:hypothetical protein
MSREPYVFGKDDALLRGGKPLWEAGGPAKGLGPQRKGTRPGKV